MTTKLIKEKFEEAAEAFWEELKQEAIKLSEKHGIPFESEFLDYGLYHIPESFLKNKDFMLLTRETVLEATGAYVEELPKRKWMSSGCEYHDDED